MRGVLGAGVLDALGRRGQRVAAWLAVLASLALPATAQAQTNTALSGITVNGTSIPGFLATDGAPQYGVSATTTTAAIVATAVSASATVAYSDADDMTVDADNVMLSDGANTVIITVTDGSVPATTYTLGVNRAVTAKYGWKADSDFDTLKLAGNKGPRGIWYDATTATFYVSDYSDDDKVYAYNTDGTRDSGKDIAVSNFPNGIWSDGTTLWVADSAADKLFAYTLSSRAADSDEDFDTLDADNKSPRGLWSDGTTMWVSDSTDKKLYAYKMSDKSRDSPKDFATLDAADNDAPHGIWSDGTTMWVSDNADNKVYAYKMSDKSHDPDKDFATLDAADNDAADNNDPRGLWSDGTTLWTTDSEDDKLYAYNLDCVVDDATRDIWCGAVTVEDLADTPEGLEQSGFSSDASKGALSDTEFMYGTNTYTIDVAAQLKSGRALYFSLTSALSDSDLAKLALHVGSEELKFSDRRENTNYPGDHTYSWITSQFWFGSSPVTLHLREVDLTINNAPEFIPDGVGGSIPENSPPGTSLADNFFVQALTATDADDDPLAYTLEGLDAASFDYDSDTGGLKTVAGVDYDFEERERVKNSSPDRDSHYELMVKADDGNGGTDTIEVTINLADVDEQSATPATPTLAAVMDSTTTLTARWTEPGLNGGPDITGLQRAVPPGQRDWQTFTHPARRSPRPSPG